MQSIPLTPHLAPAYRGERRNGWRIDRGTLQEDASAATSSWRTRWSATAALDGNVSEAAKLLLDEISGYPRQRGWGGSYLEWGRRFLEGNGGSAYIDSDHLEINLPEHTRAADHAAVLHAGLRIARQAQVAAQAKLSRGPAQRDGRGQRRAPVVGPSPQRHGAPAAVRRDVHAQAAPARLVRRRTWPRRRSSPATATSARATAGRPATTSCRSGPTGSRNWSATRRRTSGRC